MTKISVDLTGVDKLKLLSHSSIATLHRCPRKYEIYKLNLLSKDPATVDTAFGHAVGAGIQSLLVTGGDVSRAKLAAFAEWEVDLDWENLKAKKSFNLACLAIEIFATNVLPDILLEWEVLYLHDKPMIELGFLVELPNGYFYRGFIDAVLQHRTMRTLKVLELKTTKFTNVDPAMYRNSFQGVGYGVILDAIAAELNAPSEFYVDYLVYQTGSMNFLPLPFLKTFYQRAKWLDQLKLETKVIDLYQSTGNHFPMNGDSCYDFFRQCPYYGSCESDNEDLVIQQTKTSMMSDDEFAESFLSKNIDIDNLEDTCDNAITVTDYKEIPYIEEVDYVIKFEDLVANQLKQLESFHATGGSLIPTKDVTDNCVIDIEYL